MTNPCDLPPEVVDDLVDVAKKYLEAHPEFAVTIPEDVRGLVEAIWEGFIEHHSASEIASNIVYEHDVAVEEARSEYLDRAHGR